jgi:hypothetical protein
MWFLVEPQQQNEKGVLHMMALRRNGCRWSLFLTSALGLFLVFSMGTAFGQSPVTKKDSPTKWRTYTSVNGGFQFLAPGDVKDGKESIDTAVGKLVMYTHQSSAAPARLFCMAAHAEYPASIMIDFDVTKGLDGARDQAMANMKAKLLGEKKINLAGHQGRHLAFEFQTPDKQTIHGYARIYFVGNKLVQQIVFFVGKDDLQSKAMKFLDSLKLVRAKE